MSRSTKRNLTQRILVAGLTVSLISGCVGSTQSSSITKVEGPSTSHLRLERPDAAPLEASWRQEQRAIVGSVGFTRQCLLETTRTMKRTQVTTRKPNNAHTVGFIVVGSLLAVAGTGLLVASTTKSETVYCGNRNGDSGPDQCGSEAEGYRLMGSGVLTIAGALAGVGIWSAAKKPTVEKTSLPAEELKSSTPESPCGDPANLAGMTLLAALPDGSLRRGEVAADGSARIDLGNTPQFSSIPVKISVDSVPQVLEGLVSRGAPLGELTLATAMAKKQK